MIYDELVEWTVGFFATRSLFIQKIRIESKFKSREENAKELQHAIHNASAFLLLYFY